MGDAGSDPIGYSLAAATLTGSFARQPAEARNLPPPAVLAVPLYDTASVVLLACEPARHRGGWDKAILSHRSVQPGSEHRLGRAHHLPGHADLRAGGLVRSTTRTWSARRSRRGSWALHVCAGRPSWGRLKAVVYVLMEHGRSSTRQMFS